MNPAAEVPVLGEADGTIIADSGVIAEYLDDTYRDRLLIGSGLDTKILSCALPG